LAIGKLRHHCTMVISYEPQNGNAAIAVSSQMRISCREMSCRLDSACSVSPAKNSSATCRLNAVDLYRLANGRMYRLSQAADKKLEIWRGQTMQDGKGRRTGRNQGRPDVTKAINQVAYESEPPR